MLLSTPSKTFSKYHGHGNDFILFDDREGTFQGDVPSLCHRQLGIGADGVILLQRSKNASIKMEIINSDGSVAEMCGNGLRCLLHFARRLGIVVEKVETKLRTHHIDNEWVELGKPRVNGAVIDTGVPHLVLFEPYEKEKAHALRMEHNANVNFVCEEGEGLFVKTYERGAGETLCCGTGSAAAAFVYGKRWPLRVNGALCFDLREGSLWMQGPAVHVFDGVLS